MHRIRSAFTRLSDPELLAEVKRLAACEHQATANLVACLCELDSRRLYRDAGYSSLFTYATQALGLSEASAYFRIEAARAANRWPLVLERLAAGAITLSAIKLLAPHLTDKNYRELLDAARGQSKRAVEELVARLAPRPDLPSTVRKLPVPRATTTVQAASPAQVAIAAGQASTRANPSLQDPELSLDVLGTGSGTSSQSRAPVATSSRCEPAAGRAEPPHRNGRSRHIPAAVKREVWFRDSGRCTFVAPDGRRCGQRGFLEYHHAEPFAAGGEATVDNVRILCTQHNRLEAERFFAGPAWSL